MQLRLDPSAECRTKKVGRRRPQSLVARPDLAAAARDAAGKGVITPGHVAQGLDRPARGRQGRRHVDSLNDQIAAGDPFATPSRIFDQKLAVHHRDAPVAAAGEQFALLIAIAEIAQMLAERNALLRRPLARRKRPTLGRSSGTARCRVGTAFAKRLGRKAEHQHGRAGPAVGRVGGRQPLFDAGLGIAGDDAAGVAGEFARRSRSQYSSCAVTISRVTRMRNASAKVSTISVPSICKRAAPRPDKG